MVFVAGDILPPVSFSGVAIVVAVALLVPLLLGLVPRLRLPSAVLEIVAGIVIGPSVLGWVKDDVAIHVIALMGLGMLLFLAGLEIDFSRLRGPLLRIGGAAFVRLGPHRHGSALLALVPWRAADDSGQGGARSSAGGGSVALTCALFCSLP